MGRASMNADAQAKALRLRLYVTCPECARLIDLAEGREQLRRIEGADLVRHYVEEHKDWLRVLGVSDS